MIYTGHDIPNPQLEERCPKNKDNGKSCSKAQTCPKSTGNPPNTHRGDSQAMSTTPAGHLKGTSRWCLVGHQDVGGSQTCGQVTWGCHRVEIQLCCLQNRCWMTSGSRSFAKCCLTVKATRCTCPRTGHSGGQQLPREPLPRQQVQGRAGEPVGLTAAEGSGSYNTAQGKAAGLRLSLNGLRGAGLEVSGEAA